MGLLETPRSLSEYIIIVNCHIILLEKSTSLFIFFIFDAKGSPVSYYHSLSLCRRAVNCACIFVNGAEKSNLFLHMKAIWSMVPAYEGHLVHSACI